MRGAPQQTLPKSFYWLLKVTQKALKSLRAVQHPHIGSSHSQPRPSIPRARLQWEGPHRRRKCPLLRTTQSKKLYRSTLACYEDCESESAKTRLVKLLKEFLENITAKRKLLQTFQRLWEQRTREYECLKTPNEVKKWGGCLSPARKFWSIL